MTRAAHINSARQQGIRTGRVAMCHTGHMVAALVSAVDGHVLLGEADLEVAAAGRESGGGACPIVSQIVKVASIC